MAEARNVKAPLVALKKMRYAYPMVRALFLGGILGMSLPVFAADNAPHFLRVGKQSYLALTDWAEKFSLFDDVKSGRVVLERKGLPPLILLIDAPYALIGSKFVALPEAPIRRNAKIYLSVASAERIFPVLLPEKEREAFSKLVQSAEVPPAKQAVAAKPAPPVMTSAGCQLNRPVKRVFLDPGHGGEDAGTKVEGITEKSITLAFARLAADEIRRHGFEVSFSRSRDVFLPLEVRTKLAEKWKADLFISLHVNSSKRTDAHGTETYILSQEATDAEARKLALIENSIASTAKASQSAVQDILWDMEQTTYLQDSAYLASYLQGAIVANAHDLLVKEKIAGGDWKNRGVRQAPFYVLNRAAMPAVLVELGYLSNARDRKLLLSKSFQESLAKALADGVKKYREECRKAL